MTLSNERRLVWGKGNAKVFFLRNAFVLEDERLVSAIGASVMFSPRIPRSLPRLFLTNISFFPRGLSEPCLLNLENANETYSKSRVRCQFFIYKGLRSS